MESAEEEERTECWSVQSDGDWLAVRRIHSMEENIGEGEAETETETETEEASKAESEREKQLRMATGITQREELHHIHPPLLPSSYVSMILDLCVEFLYYIHIHQLYRHDMYIYIVSSWRGHFRSFHKP